MRVLLIHDEPTLPQALAEHSGLNVVGCVLPQKLAQRALVTANCRLVPFQSRRKVDFRAIRTLRALIRETRPEIVHAFWGRQLATALWATSWMRSPPHIVSFRGVQRVPSWWDPGERTSYLHPRVALQGCESAAVAKALVSAGIDRRRCRVLYNYVCRERLRRPGRAALAEWGIPERAFVVGTMTTIRPIKGIDLLLEAAIACPACRDLYLVLIGRVRDRRVEELATHPAIRERVRLVGYRSDAASLASGFDVFAMPSRQEALGTALLEAMVQGVCPLVSDAGGMPEAVGHAEEGWVVPRNNVLALAEAIQMLYERRDLVQQLAAAAQRRAHVEFSPQRMAERMIGVYRELVG